MAQSTSIVSLQTLIITFVSMITSPLMLICSTSRLFSDFQKDKTYEIFYDLLMKNAIREEMEERRQSIQDCAYVGCIDFPLLLHNIRRVYISLVDLTNTVVSMHARDMKYTSDYERLIEALREQYPDLLNIPPEWFTPPEDEIDILKLKADIKHYMTAGKINPVSSKTPTTIETKNVTNSEDKERAEITTGYKHNATDTTTETVNVNNNEKDLPTNTTTETELIATIFKLTKAPADANQVTPSLPIYNKNKVLDGTKNPIEIVTNDSSITTEPENVTDHKIYNALSEDSNSSIDLTNYSKEIPLHVIYPNDLMNNTKENKTYFDSKNILSVLNSSRTTTPTYKDGLQKPIVSPKVMSNNTKTKHTDYEIPSETLGKSLKEDEPELVYEPEEPEKYKIPDAELMSIVQKLVKDLTPGRSLGDSYVMINSKLLEMVGLPGLMRANNLLEAAETAKKPNSKSEVNDDLETFDKTFDIFYDLLMKNAIRDEINERRRLMNDCLYEDCIDYPIIINKIKQVYLSLMDLRNTVVWMQSRDLKYPTDHEYSMEKLREQYPDLFKIPPEWFTAPEDEEIIPLVKNGTNTNKIVNKTPVKIPTTIETKIVTNSEEEKEAEIIADYISRNNNSTNATAETNNLSVNNNEKDLPKNTTDETEAAASIYKSNKALVNANEVTTSLPSYNISVVLQVTKAPNDDEFEIVTNSTNTATVDINNDEVYNELNNDFNSSIDLINGSKEIPLPVIYASDPKDDVRENRTYLDGDNNKVLVIYPQKPIETANKSLEYDKQDIPELVSEPEEHEIPDAELMSIVEKVVKQYTPGRSLVDSYVMITSKLLEMVGLPGIIRANNLLEAADPDKKPKTKIKVDDDLKTFDKTYDIFYNLLMKNAFRDDIKKQRGATRNCEYTDCNDYPILFGKIRRVYVSLMDLRNTVKSMQIQDLKNADFEYSMENLREQYPDLFEIPPEWFTAPENEKAILPLKTDTSNNKTAENSTKTYPAKSKIPTTVETKIVTNSGEEAEIKAGYKNNSTDMTVETVYVSNKTDIPINNKVLQVTKTPNDNEFDVATNGTNITTKTDNITDHKTYNPLNENSNSNIDVINNTKLKGSKEIPLPVNYTDGIIDDIRENKTYIDHKNTPSVLNSSQTTTPTYEDGHDDGVLVIYPQKSIESPKVTSVNTEAEYKDYESFKEDEEDIPEYVYEPDEYEISDAELVDIVQKVLKKYSRERYLVDKYELIISELLEIVGPSGIMRANDLLEASELMNVNNLPVSKQDRPLKYTTDKEHSLEILREQYPDLFEIPPEWFTAPENEKAILPLKTDTSNNKTAENSTKTYPVTSKIPTTVETKIVTNSGEEAEIIAGYKNNSTDTTVETVYVSNKTDLPINNKVLQVTKIPNDNEFDVATNGTNITTETDNITDHKIYNQLNENSNSNIDVINNTKLKGSKEIPLPVNYTDGIIDDIRENKTHIEHKNTPSVLNSSQTTTPTYEDGHDDGVLVIYPQKSIESPKVTSLNTETEYEDYESFKEDEEDIPEYVYEPDEYDISDAELMDIVQKVLKKYSRERYLVDKYALIISELLEIVGPSGIMRANDLLEASDPDNKQKSKREVNDDLKTFDKTFDIFYDLLLKNAIRNGIKERRRAMKDCVGCIDYSIVLSKIRRVYTSLMNVNDLVVSMLDRPLKYTTDKEHSLEILREQYPDLFEIPPEWFTAPEDEKAILPLKTDTNDNKTAENSNKTYPAKSKIPTTVETKIATNSGEEAEIIAGYKNNSTDTTVENVYDSNKTDLPINNKILQVTKTPNDNEFDVATNGTNITTEADNITDHKIYNPLNENSNSNIGVINNTKLKGSKEIPLPVNYTDEFIDDIRENKTYVDHKNTPSVLNSSQTTTSTYEDGHDDGVLVIYPQKSIESPKVTSVNTEKEYEDYESFKEDEEDIPEYVYEPDEYEISDAELVDIVRKVLKKYSRGWDLVDKYALIISELLEIVGPSGIMRANDLLESSELMNVNNLAVSMQDRHTTYNEHSMKILREQYPDLFEIPPEWFYENETIIAPLERNRNNNKTVEKTENPTKTYPVETKISTTVETKFVTHSEEKQEAEIIAGYKNNSTDTTVETVSNKTDLPANTTNETEVIASIYILTKAPVNENEVTSSLPTYYINKVFKEAKNPNNDEFEIITNDNNTTTETLNKTGHEIYKALNEDSYSSNELINGSKEIPLPVIYANVDDIKENETYFDHKNVPPVINSSPTTTETNKDGVLVIRPQKPIGSPKVILDNTETKHKDYGILVKPTIEPLEENKYNIPRLVYEPDEPEEYDITDAELIDITQKLVKKYTPGRSLADTYVLVTTRLLEIAGLPGLLRVNYLLETSDPDNKPVSKRKDCDGLITLCKMGYYDIVKKNPTV